MPFIHKLARRLALCRGAALAASVLLLPGCESSPSELGPGDTYSPAADLVGGSGVLARGRKYKIARLEVSPGIARLAPEGQQVFIATGHLKDGTTVPLVVNWKASGGKIDTTGLYQAPVADGAFRVIATLNGVADTATVAVGNPDSGTTVQRLLLTPATVSLPPGGSKAFSASALMSDSTTAPTQATYAATGGTITSNGLYTAGSTAGTYRVVATAANGKADTSDVTISTQLNPTEIVLTPTPVTLVAGGSKQFSAVGKMSDGTTTNVSVVYSATGGTITPNGLYTAGRTAGSYRVVATQQSWALADTSAITITPSSSTGEPARMADSLVESIGINAHIDYGNYAAVWGSIIRPRILELGVRHIRGVGSGNVDAATLQRAQDLYRTAGIRFGKGCKHQNANFTDASHCIPNADAVGPDLIEYLGGENEMDGGDPDFALHWTQWQTAIYNAYKASPAWRGRPALMSSMSQSRKQAQLGSHPGILDIGDMHSYPGGNMPSIVSEHWIPATRAVVGPDKPIWASETGYHNSLEWTGGNQPIDERGSGKYVGRLWFEYWNRGVDRTYIYELWDQGTTTDREDHFGLLRHDGSPKPQFTVTKNLIALLSDRGPSFAPGRLDYALSGAQATTHHTLVQKRDGRFYLALWQEVSVWDRSAKQDIINPDDPVTLTLGTAAAAIKVYRPGQGTSPVQTGSGTSIALSVPDEVIVVEITP